MDIDLYTAVKRALSEDGKKQDELIAELGEMVARAKKELEPKTRVRDAALDPTHIKLARDGLINNRHIHHDRLIDIICAYLCQQGVNPDKFASTYTEFYDIVKAGLKTTIDILKETRVTKSEVKGFRKSSHFISLLFVTLVSLSISIVVLRPNFMIS